MAHVSQKKFENVLGTITHMILGEAKKKTSPSAKDIFFETDKTCIVHFIFMKESNFFMSFLPLNLCRILKRFVLNFKGILTQFLSFENLNRKMFWNVL